MYNIPDMKSWKEKLLDKDSVDHKDFSYRGKIESNTQTTSKHKLCKAESIKGVLFDKVIENMKNRSKRKATRAVNEGRGSLMYNYGCKR